jgi:aspartyl-tRNA(Asn)/glutamyl-tRNA(Gln) amidotransferase subunit A
MLGMRSQIAAGWLVSPSASAGSRMRPSAPSIPRSLPPSPPAAAQLADLGYEVEEATLPFIGNAFGALAILVYGEIVPSIKALVAGRESELHAVGAGTIGLSDPSFVDFAAAHAQAETLRSVSSGFFQKYDVLLTPVNPMTATPHGAQEVVVNGVTVPWTHVMAATSPFNLAGVPALSVPYGFSSENLPVGIQLIASGSMR